MDKVSFELTGVSNVLDNLSTLKSQVQKKLARAAARKAANVWRDKARAGAKRFDDPETSNNIAKNIVTQNNTRLGRKNGGIAMRVGVLGGAKAPAIQSGEFKGKGKGNPGGDTYYWRFLEFGTENMPAHPFMRPAQDNNAATNKFAEEMKKGIEKEKLK